MDKKEIREELQPILDEYYKKHPPKVKVGTKPVLRPLITIHHPHQTEEVKV